jgi:hypothetical protein
MAKKTKAPQKTKAPVQEVIEQPIELEIVQEEGDALPETEVKTGYVVVSNFIHNSEKYMIDDVYTGNSAKTLLDKGLIK